MSLLSRTVCGRTSALTSGKAVTFRQEVKGQTSSAKLTPASSQSTAAVPAHLTLVLGNAKRVLSKEKTFLPNSSSQHKGKGSVFRSGSYNMNLI